LEEYEVVVLAHFKEFVQHLPGGTEENWRNIPSG